MSGSYRINFIVDIAISHKRVVFFDFHKLLDYSELIFDEMIKLCWTDKTCISGFLNIHKTAIGLRIPCLAVSMLIKSHYLWRKWKIVLAYSNALARAETNTNKQHICGHTCIWHIDWFSCVAQNAWSQPWKANRSSYLDKRWKIYELGYTYVNYSADSNSALCWQRTKSQIGEKWENSFSLNWGQRKYFANILAKICNSTKSRKIVGEKKFGKTQLKLHSNALFKNVIFPNSQMQWLYMSVSVVCVCAVLCRMTSLAWLNIFRMIYELKQTLDCSDRPNDNNTKA